MTNRLYVFPTSAFAFLVTTTNTGLGEFVLSTACRNLSLLHVGSLSLSDAGLSDLGRGDDHYVKLLAQVSLSIARLSLSKS